MSTPFEALRRNEFVAQAVERLKARFSDAKLSSAEEEDLEAEIRDLILVVMKISESLPVRSRLDSGEGFYLDERGEPKDADLFGDCEPSDPEGYNRAMWESGLEQGLSVDLLTHLYGPRPEGL